MTNKRKNLKLIRIALSFMIMAFIMSVYGGVAYAESITSSLNPGDYEILDVANDNAVISANEAISTSVINETWYYVTQNSTSEDIEIPFVIYGATLARPNETDPEQSSSKITGSDTLPAGVTRMYIYTCFTGDGSKEIVELASVDITLNSAREIVSTSNATTLIAIAWSVEKDHDNDCIVYVNDIHSYSVKANSKVLEANKWVHATSGTEELVGFTDPWSSKSVQYFRYINRYNKIESAKLSNLYNNTIRPWYFKYDDSRLTLVDSTIENGDKADSADIETYNGISVSVEALPRYNAGYLKTFTAPKMKDPGSLTLDKYSLKLKSRSSSEDVIATRLGDGVISASSSNTDVATVSVSGTKITVTPKKVGTATITVSVGEGTNYTAPESKTITVQVYNPTPTLMGRDDENCIIGSRRAFEVTTYQASLVKTITFQNNMVAPTNYTKTWDVSENEDNSVLSWLVTNNEDSSMYDLYIGANGKIYAPSDSVGLFAHYSNCVSINGMEYLDTSNVTRMSSMFFSCHALTNLDLSNFNTNKVTNMTEMFEFCDVLTSLDLTKFSTDKVTDMSSMFAYCNNLTDLKIEGLATNNVTDMSEMFNACENLSVIDVSSFITNQVTDMSKMFNACKKLTNLNLNNFDTSNVTNMNYMFNYCSSLTSLTFGEKFDTSQVTDMSCMFQECVALEELKVNNFDTKMVTNMNSMFSGCKELVSLDVTNFRTYEVNNMQYMFSGCNNLINLDLSNFDTSKVTNISGMIQGCNNLTSLDLSKFDTTNVTNMSSMFRNCYKLTSLYLGEKFTQLNGSYIFFNCSKLTSIITTSTTPMTLSTDIRVASLTKLYVPNLTAEATFESATNYAEVFGADRIQPILELIGDASVTVSGTFSDPGVTVAGMSKNADSTYTPYGYTVKTSIKDSNNNEVSKFGASGKYTLTYTIYDASNSQGMSVTRTVNFVDTTPPTVSRDVERSVVTNFYGWTFEGGAYLKDDGTLVLPQEGAEATSPLIDVNYTKWEAELWVKGLSGNGRVVISSEYYNSSYQPTTNINGDNKNGYLVGGKINEVAYDTFSGYDTFGDDIKYIRIYLSINSYNDWATGSAEVPMVRITSETSNYAGVKVNVSDDNLDTSSLKYLWSRQSTGITEAQVTNSFTNGSVIKLPYGSQGTWYLWILAKDTAGNTYLSAVDNTIRDTIKIDNPQIEAVESDKKATSAGKEITVYSFNAENKNTSHYIQTVGGGQTEDVASRYVGSKAYKLTKGGEITSENGQWHGVQLTTTAFSNLSANTYVIVSSDYKTTNPAGLSQFEACGIAKPNWSGHYSVTAMLLDLKINSDGNWHHTSDIFKLNEATQNTNDNIITSGMPNWGYSFQTGELYVDGIQWFIIPEENLNDGVAVKKWAVGNQTKEYMRNNGTTYTGNSFVTQTNGTHTLYMLTSDGMEIIKTIEVTGVDTAGPDVSITLNGDSLYFGQDPDFANGNNGIGTYNNNSNGTVTITREDYNNAPNTSGKVLHIKTTGEASPGHGGFYFANNTSANKIYVSKIVAKIPVGYTINLGSNSIGANAYTEWLTSQAGTGDWETYVLYVRAGSSGNFSSTNYFYLEGGTTATSDAPVDWYVAYANLYANDLMSWTNQDKTLQGEILDANSGTVAYAFTRTRTEPTTWTTIENNEGTVRPTYTATENGFYYLWAKDAAGNVSMTATCVERIDKEAPVVTNITLDPAGWTNGSVKLYFDATDNLSGVSEYSSSNWGYEYCIYYQTMTPSTNVSKQQFEDYSYNRSDIYLQIKDQAGNIGQYKMSVSNIDKTAPIFVDGVEHSVQEYYDNAEKGRMLESEAEFSVVPGGYRGGTLSIVSINDGTVNSDKVLKITHPAGDTQSGYMRIHYYDTSKVYVRKIYAKIPTGYTLNITGNAVSGNINWLTSTAGTGEWQEYAYVFIVLDESKSNMDYGHAFIDGIAPTSSFDWYVATDVTYDATYIFNNAKVTYSGANAILNIEAKDTQSGTNSITVNDVAQTLTKTTTSAKTDYTVSSTGTYKVTATDAVGNVTTMTKTAYAITYNANGGTGSMAVEIKIDGADRTLTTNSFTRYGYEFIGWNTSADGSGTAYAQNATYTGDANVTLYAQWKQANYTDGTNYYATLREAFANATSGSTITVLKNVEDNEKATVESGKSFVLDSNGNTITVNGNGEENYYFIHNYGNLETKDTKGNGKIELNVSQKESKYNTGIFANWEGNLTVTSGIYDITGTIGYTYTINKLDGTLNINGGTIMARATGSELVTGIAMVKGTVNITGGTIKAYDETNKKYVYGVVNTAKYSANIKITGGDIYGDVNGVALTNHTGGSGVLTSTLEVSGNPTIEGGKYGIGIWYCTGDVQVKSGTIKGGTYGICRASTGKLRIGDNSDKVSITLPVIQGGVTGIDAQNSFEFYDGILKGKTQAYTVEPDVVPNGYAVYNDTETIDGATYKTAYLVPYLMQREDDDYVIGYTRPGSSSEYKSTQIKTITIQNTDVAPAGYIASWDVSQEEKGLATAWLVKNANYTENEPLYDLYIGAKGKLYAPEYSSNLFMNYSNCVEIKGLEYLDTSNVIRMMKMFYNCSGLTRLDVNGFDTSSVTNMREMFYACSNLTSLDVSKFDTSKVTDMYGMFSNCSGLTSLDVSNFDTINVTNMDGMFRDCSSLTSLDVSNFDTSSVTSMAGMFYACSNLTSLNVSSFDTINVTNMNWMFLKCSSLTSLNVSGFNTSNVIRMMQMFYACSSLKTLHLGENFDKLTGVYMFTGCTSLTAIITTRTSPMTLSTDIVVESLTKLYVPSVEAETAYEGTTNYSTVFGADRIRPILELVGDSTIDVEIGTAYTEAGVTVAGMNKNSDNTYTPYGYTVSGPVIKKDGSTVSSVDTNSTGTYTLTYTIYDSSNTQGMSVTRTVKVYNPNYQDDAGNYYATLKEAFDNAKSGSTITVLKDNTDSSEAIVESGKTFILDTNGKTVTKTISGITNNGTLTIQGNGTIETLEQENNKVLYVVTNNGMLNIGNVVLSNKGSTLGFWTVVFHRAGTTNLETGTLKITGETSGYYNGRAIAGETGTINIKSGRIESNAIGIHSYDNATLDVNIYGGNIECDSNAVNITNESDNNQTNLYITGGTLISESTNAIIFTSSGKLIIGDNSNKVSTTSPVIQGGTYGVSTTSKFEFYDGILKGKTQAYTVEPDTIPTGYEICHDTETIDGEVYKTAYLVPIFTISDVGSFTYNGNPHTPEITVTANGKTLNPDTDYNVAYTNNVDAGTATITVTGKGEYKGSKATKTFTINQADGFVELSDTTGTVAYGTSSKTFEVTRHHGGELKVAQTTNTDAKVSISNGVVTITNLASLDAGTKVEVIVTSSATTNYKSATAKYTLTVETAGKIVLDITLNDVGPFVYNGQAQTPAITVKANGTTINSDTDYDVSYANNVNAGTATITVTGKGNYEGSNGTKDFTIATKEVAVVWSETTSLMYNGQAQVPTATVDSGIAGETINLNVTGNATNVGSYTATASIASVTGGQGKASNYTLSGATKDFTIITRAIQVSASSKEKVYDGTPLSWEDLVPGYKVVGANGLAEGHTIEVERSGSITNVGTATHQIGKVTVKDASGNDVTSNYTISRSNGMLTIKATNSAKFDISFANESKFIYDGTEIEPEIIVKVDDKVLTKDKDYIVKYSENINASENAKILVTGIGNYNGSSGNKLFTINKRSLTITTKSMSKVYDGSLLKYSDIAEPRYTVSGLVSRDTLTVVTAGQILNVGSEDHTVTSYTIKAGEEDSENNYNVTIVNGKLEIISADITPTVNMNGYTYGGTVSTPSVIGNLGGGDVKYYYRKDGSTTTSEWTTSITSTTLDAGTYYIYAVVGASKNYNGATTAEKSFEVAKRKVTLTSASASKVYDGTALTATGVTTSGLAEGDTLSAEANASITNVGSVKNTFTYDILRNGESVKDNYEVTKVEGTLTITSANIKDRVTVELPDDYDYTYDDTEKEPKPIVKDGDKVLEEGKDYTIDYDDNIDANEGEDDKSKVVVKGSGDYSGEVIETFEITKRKITVKVTDVSKIYDGTPLTSDEYELTSGSVVAGHQLTVEISGSQTEIGSSENTITKLIITKVDNTDVTKNYNITKVNGLLTITGETITGNVTLEGVTEVGSTLIANTIGITPANCDFEYKWYVTEEKSLTGGTLIANENEDIYVVRGSDVGKYIYVEVIASVKGAVSTTFKDITDEVIRKGESGGDIDSGDREVDVENKNLNSSDITVELPKNFDYTYDDTEKEPKPTVKDGDKVLEEDKDYTIDYEDNVDANEDKEDKSKVVITGKGNYSGEVIKTFEITKRELTVKLIDASKVYDGTPLTSSEYDITSGSLVSGHKMTITTYGSQTNVGESTNTISSLTIVNADSKDVITNYNVTKESGKLTVIASGSETFEITLNEAGPFTYNGKAHTPEITVKVGNKELIKETDYTVDYTDNLNAGTAEIIVTGKGNYAGSNGRTSFKISPKMVAVVWNETTFIYNGELQGPTATVNSGVAGETIKLNVTGLARNAGTHTVTASIASVTGGQGEVNNYALSKATQNYEITARKVTLTSVSASKVYDGTPLTATGVTASAKTETEGIVDVDTLSAEANGTITNVGSVKNTFTYDIVRDGVSVKNNYEVIEINGTLTITSANIKDRVTVELPKDFDYTYDDTEKEPKPIVKDGDKVLEEGKDYTVDYENNVDANEGEDDKSKAVIKGSGDYSGEVIETFEITKRKITVKLTDASKDYDGTPLTSNAYSITSGELVTGHTMSVTGSGSQTDVGESINTINTVTIVNVNGKDVTSNYSVTKEAGTLKVTKAEIKGSVTIEGNAVVDSTLTANTDAIIPAGCDLTYQWFANETNSTSGGTEISGATNKTYTIESGLTGKYIYVEVTANKANYEEKTFKDITDSSNSADGKVEPKDISDVTVKLPKDFDYTYDDTEKEPKPTVKDGDKVLEEGKDYTIDYDDNIDANEGEDDKSKVVIKGSGDYSGEVIETFEITKRKISVKLTDASKVYDGTSLTSNAHSITSGSLVTGHTMSVTGSGSQTNVGESINSISTLIIKNANGKDVTSNYSVTEQAGILVVTNAEIKGSVAIEGKAVIGSTLTANTDAITPADCNLTYRWFYNETNSTSGGTEISGATNKTYTIGSGLTGKYIYVEVTASKANYAEKTFKDITDSSNSTDGKVEPKDISKVTVELPKDFDYTYDDTEKEPKPTVKDGDKVLEEGKDYTIDYENNVDANEDKTDKSKVVIKGTGDYEGEVIETFEITKRKITVKPLDAKKDYDGTELTSNQYVLVSGSLVNGHKLTITTSGSQTEIGSSDNEITSVSIVNVSGNNVKQNYNITTEKGTLTINGVYIEGGVEITGVTRVGKLLVANVINVTPAGCEFTYKWYVSDTNSTENGTLIEGENEIGYIVRESDLGKYIYVEVTATRSASPAKVFKDITDEVIAPKGTTGEVDSGDREVEVIPTISGEVTITGDNVYGSTLTADTSKVLPSDCNFTYQWYYSENGDGTGLQEIVGATNKTYVVGDNTEESLIGKYIYVKVHAEKKDYASADFIDVTDAENNKFDKVEEKDLNSPDVTITLEKDEFTYDGTEHKPNVEIKHNGKTLEEGKDYDVTYKKNIDAGSGEVEIVGKGNYEGTVIKVITIKPMEINVPWGSTTEFVYNGKPQAPSVGTAQGAKDEMIYFTRTTEVNAGKYTSEASIEKVVGGREKAENYILVNDTKDYEIQKAEAKLTLSSYNVEVVEGNKFKVTYEYVGDGAISYTEIDRNIATFEVKGEEIIITGVKEGTTTLKLTAKGTNYTDVEATVNIKVLVANYNITNDNGSTNYNKLQDAIDSAESGDTITVIKDVNEPDGATIDKDITIDLKDKTITTEEPIKVTPNGDVTIIADTNDNDETGTIKNPDGTAIDNEGTVNIGNESGDHGPIIDGKDVAIDSKDGDFNFNDGKLIGDDNPPYKGEPDVPKGKYIVTEEENGRYVSKLEVDTVPPVISLYEDKDIVMGPSDKVGLLINIFEAGSGLDIDQFSEGDLIYEVNGERVYPTYERITFVKLINKDTYRYYLEFGGITKSGNLTIRIEKDMVFDKAGLGNEATILTEGKIVVDITPPDLSDAELVLIKPENGITNDGEYEAKISGVTDDNGIGEYQWEIRKDGEDEWEIIKTDSANNSTSYVSGAVEDEGTYYIRVKVSDLIGNSTYSNTVSFVYEEVANYNAKPTIKFTKNVVEENGVVTSVKIHTIIKSTTNIVSIKVNGVEISNLNNVLNNAVVEGKFQIRTEFDYEAYANTIYKFEVKDANGNVSTEICNVSDFNRNSAKVTYEIIDASVYGNAKIVFMSDEPIKVKGELPNGFSINRSEANKYSTTIVVDVAEHIKEIDHDFKFANTVEVETNVHIKASIETVARRILTISNKRVLVKDVYGTIDTAKANELVGKMKNAKYMNGNKVDSFYGTNSYSVDFKVTSDNALDAVKTLGGATNIQITKTKGNVVELDASTAIISSATSGIEGSANANMTGVYDLNSGDSFHVTIINK